MRRMEIQRVDITTLAVDAIGNAVRETAAELAANPALEKVIFACFDPATEAAYRRAVEQIR